MILLTIIIIIINIFIIINNNNAILISAKLSSSPSSCHDSCDTINWHWENDWISTTANLYIIIIILILLIYLFIITYHTVRYPTILLMILLTILFVLTIIILLIIAIKIITNHNHNGVMLDSRHYSIRYINFSLHFYSMITILLVFACCFTLAIIFWVFCRLLLLRYQFLHPLFRPCAFSALSLLHLFLF